MADFLQIFTFGQPEIHLNQQRLPDFPTRKVEALLIYLAYTARAHSREHLADLLWDERSHEQALTNLRASLSRLNRQLAPFVRVSRPSIAIQPEAQIWLDARAFSQGVTAPGASDRIRSPHLAAELETLVALYRGDFLEGFHITSTGFEAWLSDQRRSLAHKLAQTLALLVGYYLEAGDYGRGTGHVLRLLQLDPLDEAAHRQYMRLLAASGQRSAALAQYENCRQLLADELHTEPDDLTTELYQQIRAGQLPTSRRSRLDALPVQTTAFVGREAELQQLGEHLANPDCRLLTLVGAGGAGKTRLAYQVATHQMHHFADGICLVVLEGVNTADQLVLSLAEALRFTLRSSRDPRSQLLNYLADKNLLIIFDNCEHLVDRISLVSDILKTAAGIKILATSRERLNLQGEWLFVVEGLDYPEGSSTRDVAAYPAVALFLQTARRVRSDYQPDDPAAVVTICQMVRGMPLAIELAAGWSHQLSATGIAAQIQQDLSLLSTNLSDIPERHRSIRLLFDHTWQLLTAEAQQALMQLAVFQGHIFPEAAYAVGKISLLLLSSLVEKSVLQASSQGAYHLHDLLRRYALEKLEAAGQLEAAASRHADYFSARLNALYQDTGKRRAASEQVREDYDNYAAALAWGVRSRNIDLLAALMQKLAYYWETAFKISEAVDWSRAAIELINSATSPVTQARIYIYAGVFARYEPDIPRALAQLERGIEFARQAEDPRLLIEGMHVLGQIQLSQGQYEAARQAYAEHLAIAQHIGHEYEIGRAHYNLGSVALETDQLALAKEQLELALRYYRKQNVVSSALLCNLGILWYLEGDFASAEYYFKESLAAARADNAFFNIITNLINLGDVAVENQDDEGALHYYLEAFEAAIHSGHKLGQTGSLTGLAQILVRQAKFAFAAYLLGAVEAQRQTYSLPTESYNEAKDQAALDQLKASLGADGFTLHWNRGFSGEFQTISQSVLNKAWETAVS